jgi:hypothetical protein
MFDTALSVGGLAPRGTDASRIRTAGELRETAPRLDLSAPADVAD